MKKLFLILCLACLLTSAFVVNAEVDVDDATSTVTLSGTVQSGEAGVRIGVDVFCPDKTYSDFADFNANRFSEIVVLRNQTVSGEKGKWEMSFEIYDDPNIDYDAKSGIYTAVIFPENYENSYTETFAYLNLKAAENLITNIKENGTQESISQLISEHYADLGLSYDFVSNDDNRINAGKTATLILDAVKEGLLSNTELVDNINVIRTAAVIQAVSEGKINNLFEYADALALDQKAIGTYYKKNYVAANASAITSALQTADYKTYKEFYEKLNENTVLQVVKNPDGVGNIKEIVNLFADKSDWIGNYSSEAYTAVQGKVYNSYAELKNSLDAANDTQGGGGGRIPSRGSTGGSSPISGGTSFVESSQGAGNGTMEYNIFNDIGNISWAKDAIIYLAQADIVNGKTESQFCPNDNITREELAKILVQAFAKDAEESEVSFKDTNAGEWYYPYIARAVSAGIVNGYSEEEFGTGRFVTRQEMCAMVYRAAQAYGISLESSQPGFADETEIEDYAKEAIGALSNAEIVVGIDLNHFAPNDMATRAQIAKIVYRLLMLGGGRI